MGRNNAGIQEKFLRQEEETKRLLKQAQCLKGKAIQLGDSLTVSNCHREI